MSTTSASLWARRPPARLVVGAFASCGWVSLYVLGGFSFDGASSDRRALYWAGAMVASFAGWGSALARLWDKEAEVDWGLRAAWGMAVIILLGGVLVAAGIGSLAVLRLLVGVGVGILCAEAVGPRAAPWRPRWDPAYWTVVSIVVTLAFLTCVGSMTDRGPRWGHDDTPAYLVFPKQFLETGDMLQPFSFRRMASFGAQSFLQACLLVAAAPEQLHLFDRGICSVVVVAMIVGAPHGRRSSPFVLRLFPALLVLLVPYVRLNLAAVLSGTVFFFAIHRTLELPESPTRRPRMHPVVLGLLVAGACALRPFFVLPATATVALAYVFDGARTARKTAIVSDACIALGVTLLALVPWSLALLRSNGTPLYPPFDGDYQAEAGFARIALGYGRAKMVWALVRGREPLAAIHLFFAAGLVGSRRQGPAFRGSFFALLLGFAAVALLVPASDPRELVRYVYPMVIALALVVTMRGLEAFAADAESTALVSGFLVLAACAGELYSKHEDEARAYDDIFEQAYNVMVGRALLPGAGRPQMYQFGDDDFAETPTISLRGPRTYAALQRAIPAGARVLAMVEEPYQLDFKRNRFDILDLPGIVGPKGGIPVLEGPEAVEDYLRALGYRYLMLADPRTSTLLYSQRGWNARRVRKTPGPARAIAPRVLDVFDNLEWLIHSRPHLFEEGGIVVLDLGGPN